MSVDPADLVSAVDIADMLAVGPAAVSNWQARHEDFPKPVVTVARGNTPLWLRRPVIEWFAARHPRSLIAQTYLSGSVTSRANVAA